jgi:hypothetical protein
VVAFVDRTLPLYTAALRALRDLRVPHADAATVRAWLAADTRVEAALRALGAAAERRDFPSTAAASSAVVRAGADSRRAAATIGLRVCATGR